MNKLGFSLAVAAFCISGIACAGQTGPEKATELLARAWMIDNRCDVLGRAARDELTNLVARAEISLAGKVSVKKAKSAIAAGRAAGSAAPCGEQSAKFVERILAAAMSASGITDADGDAAAAELAAALAPTAKPAGLPVVPEPVAKKAAESKPVAKLSLPPQTGIDAVVTAIPEGQLERKPKKLLPPRKPPGPKPALVNAAAVNGYAVTAEAYYRELRCRTLSQRSVNAMYARVLREHRRAVAASGRSAVRRLLRAAEARASGRSC